ncbi:MAG: Nif3-like dinuclear metal center hexameric protein, partial [Chitinophagaceae bacterium]
MKIATVLQALETWAPPAYQESYDNSGLLTGSTDWNCTGVICCLDVLEAVVDEAIAHNCNLIVAHHPIIFSGLKQITGKNYIERVVIKAIKNDIAIYAIHTNLDNVKNGVNYVVAAKLGLTNLRILDPKQNLLQKLYTFVPFAYAEIVKKALFAAGAGHIGAYEECSFSVEGEGTFKAKEGANPFVGDIGVRHSEPEVKMEVVFSAHMQKAIVKALIAALNNPSRVNDRTLWKKQLEAVFDVKGFLKYLAVNNTVGNWDTYGQVMHNYFLVSTDGILRWVPYDLNLSFQQAWISLASQYP